MIKTVRIDSKFQVNIAGQATFDGLFTAQVDEIWNAAKEMNSSLFDGEALAVQDFSATALNCAIVSYKYFFAQQKHPELAVSQPLQLAGVSGIVRFDTNIMYGKRGQSVTQYPGAFELVPSGSLPAGSVGEAVDYRAHLLDELREEAGIQPGLVRDCRPVLLVVDDTDRVVDICCFIDLASEPPMDAAATTGEYDSLQSASLDILQRRIAEKPQLWVPTSVAILRNLAG